MYVCIRKDQVRPVSTDKTECREMTGHLCTVGIKIFHFFVLFSIELVLSETLSLYTYIHTYIHIHVYIHTVQCNDYGKVFDPYCIAYIATMHHTTHCTCKSKHRYGHSLDFSLKTALSFPQLFSPSLSHPLSLSWQTSSSAGLWRSPPPWLSPDALHCSLPVPLCGRSGSWDQS